MTGTPPHLVRANHSNGSPTEQEPTTVGPKVHRGKTKTRPSNPLQAGIVDFLERHGSLSSGRSFGLIESLTAKPPKRYTLYPPLLLLPKNVFTATPEWRDFYTGLSGPEKLALNVCIADAFCGRGPGVTHIAVNAPIAAEVGADEGESGGSGVANVMRSPAGLVPLYGDWGPRSLVVDFDCEEVVDRGQPTKRDFERAFWVAAGQNGGIVQVWAPLYTMFSRGNVKEKARILGEGDGVFEGMEEDKSARSRGEGLTGISVVDLFVGIGYFAFSYLKRGVGLVWGWEINGWSVEGLRRGCKMNGWKVEVFRVRKDGLVVDEEGREGDSALEGLVENLIPEAFEDIGKIRCVVFHGDNRWSGKIMTRLKELSLREQVNGEWKSVRHVNLGLLPDARDSWQNSVTILDSDAGGWLHIHENMDVRDFESRKYEIVQEIGKLVAADVAKCGQWEISCCHLEQVKTYAPGVMHCVFDIQILPAR